MGTRSGQSLSNGRAAAWAFLLALFFLPLAALRADERDLVEARAMETAGRPAAACSVYRAVLERPVINAESFRALARLIAIESDAESLLRSVRGLLSRAKNAQLPPALALQVSDLFQLAGSPADALPLALSSLSSGGPAAALGSAVLLSVETNDLAGAEAVLNAHGGSETASVLRGWLLLARGDAGGAQAAFTAAGPTLEGLSGQYAAAEAGGDAAELAKASAALVSAFPLAPEAVIARQRATPDSAPRVVSAPTPHSFLPPGPAPSPAAPAGSPGPESAARQTQQQPAQGPPQPAQGPVRAVSVQAGSFGMRENADDMVLELRKKGFLPTIQETSAGGRILFKVLALSRAEPGEAAAAVARLRELGYECYVFTDSE